MVLLLLLTLLMPWESRGISQPATTLPGTVVGYSPFARLVIIVGSPPPSDIKPFHEDFLIRLDRELPPLKKGQLIRLKYSDDTGTKPARPTNLFTEKRHWAFVATRDASCASKLENLLHYTVNGQTFEYMQLTRWANRLQPVDYTVPCYIVAAGGISEQ
ncbi:MAG TPA: hypothetical protein VEM96_00825 [Pyrinomonadaceae bacterium]|nr:hypothetical protein [Pyrinomonadaceae bacterium]